MASLPGPGWRSGRRGHRGPRPAPWPRRRGPPSGADPASSWRSLQEEPVAVPGLGEREVGTVVGPPALLAGGGRRDQGPGAHEQVGQLGPGRVVAAGLLGDPPEGGVGLAERSLRCAAPRRLRVMARWSSSRNLARSPLGSSVRDGNDRATWSGRAQMTPSTGRSRITGRMAPVASGPLFPRSMASTTRGPNTMPSSRELEARRLAPWTPVQATSPAGPQAGQGGGPVEVGQDAAGEVVGGGGHRQPVARRVRGRCHVPMRRWSGSGRRRLETGGVEPQVVDALLEHAGRHGLADHVPRRAARRRTARPGRRGGGRRGPAGPRRAGAGASAGWCRAVGWNCMNSTSATGTPARRAMARPSPVDWTGLVVTANSWPAPPVASIVSVARTSTRLPSGARAVTPRHCPSATIKSRANQPSRTAAAVRCTAETRARSISAPVAAPPAWTTRGIEWPPSRASCEAAAFVGVEHRAEGDQLVDPVRALVDQHPHGVGVAQPGAGGQGVGQMEVGGVLILGESTAATPPWAHRVADWDSSALDSTPMRRPPGAGWPPPAPRPRGRRRRCRGSGGPDRGWSARSGCHRVVSSAIGSTLPGAERHWAGSVSPAGSSRGRLSPSTWTMAGAKSSSSAFS